MFPTTCLYVFFLILFSGTPSHLTHAHARTLVLHNLYSALAKHTVDTGSHFPLGRRALSHVPPPVDDDGSGGGDDNLSPVKERVSHTDFAAKWSSTDYDEV